MQKYRVYCTYVIHQIDETDGGDLSGVRGQNGSLGRCWGRIFAVSVKGDVLRSLFTFGAREISDKTSS